jgi:hypothetical protein
MPLEEKLQAIGLKGQNQQPCSQHLRQGPSRFVDALEVLFHRRSPRGRTRPSPNDNLTFLFLKRRLAGAFNHCRATEPFLCRPIWRTFCERHHRRRWPLVARRCCILVEREMPIICVISPRTGMHRFQQHGHRNRIAEPYPGCRQLPSSLWARYYADLAVSAVKATGNAERTAECLRREGAQALWRDSASPQINLDPKAICQVLSAGYRRSGACPRRVKRNQIGCTEVLGGGTVFRPRGPGVGFLNNRRPKSIPGFSTK